MSTAPPPCRLVPAREAAQFAQARELFREYAESLGFRLDFQGFEAELAELPGDYREPAGTILLAFDAAEAGAERAAGCVALRPLAEAGMCEMKRMYVRPEFRGRGLGRALGERILAEARTRGYRTMRLDTVEKLEAAIALYESLGFRRIPPYGYNPVPTALYFEATL